MARVVKVYFLIFNKLSVLLLIDCCITQGYNSVDKAKDEEGDVLEPYGTKLIRTLVLGLSFFFVVRKLVDWFWRCKNKMFPPKQGADYSVVFISLPELTTAYGMDLSTMSLAYVAETTGMIAMAALLGGECNSPHSGFN